MRAFGAMRHGGLMSNRTFEQVVVDTQRPLASMAHRMLRDAGRAEEVTQDALAVLYRDWDRIENPSGFAFAAVRNRCRDVQRREIRARAKAPLLRPIESGSEATNPYLSDVLAKLSPSRREIVVLRFYGGHTLPEIARITGHALGTVKSNLARALDQLRVELTDVIEPGPSVGLVAA